MVETEVRKLLCTQNCTSNDVLGRVFQTLNFSDYPRLRFLPEVISQSTIFGPSD